MDKVFDIDDINNIDILIINNLIENGTEYLYNCLQRTTDSKQLKYVYNYLFTYLTNDDLFEDSINDFIIFTCNNKIDMWTDFINSSHESHLSQYKSITKSLYVSYENLSFEFDEHIHFIKTFIFNDSINDNIFESIENLIINLPYILKVLESLPDEFNDDIFEILLKTILNHNILFLKELLFTLFTHINIININPENISLTSNKTLFKFFRFICYIYNNHIKNDDNTVDYTIVNETIRSLLIALNKYNTESVLFYLLLNSLRIIYVPFITKITIWTKDITNIENQLLSLNEKSMLSSSPILQSFIIKLYKLKKETEDKITFMIESLNHMTTSDNILYFYKHLVTIIPENTTNIDWDETISTMGTFLKYRKQNDLLIEDITLIKFIIDVIKTKEYTVNPHTRCQYIHLVDTQEFTSPELQVVDAVIILTNDLELTKDEGLYIEKIKSRGIVYDFLLDRCFNEDNEIKEDVELHEINTTDSYKIKTFINFMLLDLTDTCKFLKSYTDKYIAINDDLELQINTATLENLLTYIDNAIKIINGFSVCLSELCYSDEILLSLRILLKSFFNVFTPIITDEQYKQKLSDIYEYTYVELNYKDIAVKMINFLILYTNTNDDLVCKLFYDSDGLDINIIEKYIDIHENIQTLCDRVKLLNNIDELEYPDEYLDSLVYTPLKNPVLIPNTDNVIVNRETIEHYIMIDRTNPFTREQLTLEDLNKFNEIPNNKNKIDQLLQDIESWKKSSK